MPVRNDNSSMTVLAEQLNGNLSMSIIIVWILTLKSVKSEQYLLQRVPQESSLSRCIGVLVPNCNHVTYSSSWAQCSPCLTQERTCMYRVRMIVWSLRSGHISMRACIGRNAKSLTSTSTLDRIILKICAHTHILFDIFFCELLLAVGPSFLFHGIRLCSRKTYTLLWW